MRAPHKTLLVLYAIGKLLQGKGRLIPYSEVDEKLGKLLRDLGPRRKNFQTHQPLWRFRSDSVWEIPAEHKVGQTNRGDAKKSDLDRHDVTGGFTECVARQLCNDSDLALQIV